MADWVMVGITTIYVIATVIMCYFNYKALALTKQQLSETNRQFCEQQKTSSMPILQVKLVDTDIKINGMLSDYKTNPIVFPLLFVIRVCYNIVN